MNGQNMYDLEEYELTGEYVWHLACNNCGFIRNLIGEILVCGVCDA